MNRALVLGGGGVLGVAWEGGLIAGIVEGAPGVSMPDSIVGTSSGAFIGVRLASGMAPDQVFPVDNRIDLTPPLVDLPDKDLLREVLELWTKPGDMSTERRLELGAISLRANTVSEDYFIARTGSRVEVDDWPDMDFRATAVDVATGALRVFDRACGLPMQRCITASCAIPAMFPPILLGGARYMDGGVRSSTNADVLLSDEPGKALIIGAMTPVTSPFGRLAEVLLAREVSELEARGWRTFTIVPDDEDAPALTNHLLDAARTPPCRERGYKRGLALAGRVAEFWG